MPELKVIPQRQQISGTTGAVRVNPSINNPVFAAAADQGAAIRGVGQELSRAAEAFQAHQIAQQAAVDFTQSNKVLREAKEELAQQNADHVTRNDYEEFEKEFTTLAAKIRNDTGKNRKISEDARTRLETNVQNLLSRTGIGVENTVNSKKRVEAETEFKIEYNKHLEAGDGIAAEITAEDARDTGILSQSDFLILEQDRPQAILYFDVRDSIDINPQDTDEILNENKDLSDANFTRLRAHGSRLFAIDNANFWDDYTADWITAIDSGNVDMATWKSRTVAGETKGFFNRKQTALFMRQIDQGIIDQTSAQAQAEFRNIIREMTKDPNFDFNKAMERMALIEGNLTNKDFSGFIDLTKKLEAMKDRLPPQLVHVMKLLDTDIKQGKFSLFADTAKGVTVLENQITEIRKEAKKEAKKLPNDGFTELGEASPELLQIVRDQISNEERARTFAPSNVIEGEIQDELEKRVRSFPNEKPEDTEKWYRNRIATLSSNHLVKIMKRNKERVITESKTIDELIREFKDSTFIVHPQEPTAR
jgi:hypothetical protein